MSRILPSQAVSAIESMFPQLLQTRPAAVPPPSIPYAYVGSVSATLALLAEVPTDLLQLTGADLAGLVTARAKATTFIASCAGPFTGQTPMDGDILLSILHLLKRCPDQAVPASTADLLFVTDAVLRESLRVDIAEVRRAISDGEWKSATVVA